MELLNKQDFIRVLEINPIILIDKEIIFEDVESSKRRAKILDISFSGNFLLLEYPSKARKWTQIDRIMGSVAVEGELGHSASKTTAASVNQSINELKKLIGESHGESPKPLFDVIANLNKDILELKMKVEKMEEKKL